MGGPVQRTELLRRILIELDRWYQVFLKNEALVLREWETLNVTLGKRVTVAGLGETFAGEAQGIDHEGRLILREVESRFAPQLVIYLAGADVHENDRLGKLALTVDGMRARDERVFAFASRLGVPIAVTMAGGYGRGIDLTVELHLQTIRLAYSAWIERSAAREAVASA